MTISTLQPWSLQSSADERVRNAILRQDGVTAPSWRANCGDSFVQYASSLAPESAASANHSQPASGIPNETKQRPLVSEALHRGRRSQPIGQSHTRPCSRPSRNCNRAADIHGRCAAPCRHPGQPGSPKARRTRAGRGEILPGGLTAQVSLEVVPASLSPSRRSPRSRCRRPRGLGKCGRRSTRSRRGCARLRKTMDRMTCLVIERMAAPSLPSLNAPENGASGVFAGNTPNAGVVIIPVEWNAVPSALSGIPEISHSPPGGRWQVDLHQQLRRVDRSQLPRPGAEFSSGPGSRTVHRDSSYGPESEV